MYDQFAKSLGVTAAPPPSPLGAPDAGLLANYTRGNFLNQAAGAQVGGKVAANNVNVANQKAQEDYQKQLKIADLKDQAQKVLDNANGKNWQQIPKPDGGYDFKDATGKPVTVAQYASATGQDPTKVLSGSKNPLDIQHNADYQKVEALSNALASNDQASLQKLAIQIYGDNSKTPDDKVNQAALKKIDSFKKLSPGSLYQAFINFYPHVYGQNFGGQNQSPASPGADTLRSGGVTGAPYG